MATFTWIPSIDATKEITPRVRAAAFGDGYIQRVGDGINAQPASWSLRFAGRAKVEADLIEAFLVALAGVESFDWTDPNGRVGKWVCESWSRQELGATLASLSATFKQVYGE